MPRFKQVSFHDMWTQFAEAPEPETTPSQQYNKLRSCLSKKAYVTLEMAEKALQKANRSDTGVYHKYKCEFCHLFHIGHIRRKDLKNLHP